MIEYNPDKYVLLRVTSPDETYYRVFGTWYGGYTTGDSWRMNSGIERVEIDGDKVSFIGASGSVYNVHKEAQGLSMYTRGVLLSSIDQAKGMDITVEMLSLEEYLKETNNA